jgi:hypothetical protein
LRWHRRCSCSNRRIVVGKKDQVTNSKRFKVLAIMSKSDGSGEYFTRVGNAFENKDSSINVYMDLLPLGNKQVKLQLRELNEQDLREREASRARSDAFGARPHGDAIGARSQGESLGARPQGEYGSRSQGESLAARSQGEYGSRSQGDPLGSRAAVASASTGSTDQVPF